MSTQFTPGPWEIEEYVKAGGVIHLAVTNREAAPNWMPCSITPMHLARDIDYANASLIAAAPELLDALQECEHLLWHDSKGDCPRGLAAKRARAAIAKAKGEL